MLITFEGTEGVGKTTVIQGVKKHLEARGYYVEVYREPGATRIGEEIRKLLLNTTDEPLCLAAEVLLFYAARVQNIEQNLRSTDDPTRVRLIDRYIDSSKAYQSYGRGFDLEKLKVLNEFFVTAHPDITFWLDVPLDIANSRTQKRGNAPDRIEQESNAFFERVRNGFAEIHENEPHRVKRIDASQSEDLVLRDILCILDQKLND